mmetsp:Transcript_28802/g.89890  ORF Transcript_28802/g.89890 Transcript_28802/m.89890 type:complete len:436 (+) Transcript_28802:337-1644(+)
MRSAPLQDECSRPSAAVADRRDTVAALLLREDGAQGGDNAGAAAPDGVPQRARATQHVHPLGVQAQELHVRQHHDRKRLVDLEVVDVLEIQLRPLERLLDGNGGRGGEPLGLLLSVSKADDPREGLQPRRAQLRPAGKQQRCGPVRDGRAARGGHCSVLLEGWPELWEHIHLATHVLVICSHRLSRLCLWSDRHNLLRKGAALVRRPRALVAAGRELVLLLAANAVLTRAQLAKDSHGEALVEVGEAVVRNPVHDLLVAVAQPAPGPGLARDVERHVAHALHASGDDHVRLAGHDALRTHRDGLHAGRADLVDCGAADGLGEASAEGGLARWGLLQAGAQDVAHDALLDLVSCQPRGVEAGVDGRGAQLRGRHIHEAAAEAADGCPFGRHDVNAAVGNRLCSTDNMCNQAVDAPGHGHGELCGPPKQKRLWSRKP